MRQSTLRPDRSIPGGVEAIASPSSSICRKCQVIFAGLRSRSTDISLEVEPGFRTR